MVPDRYDVTVAVERLDGAVVLRTAGELDMLTTPELQESITRELAVHPAVLVLDLSEVSFMASRAMAAIVAAHQEAGERTQLRIVAAGRATARPLEVAGLTGYLSIYGSLEAALDA
ncbi:MAG TPA: STAS domain-containing protein [Actinophytocola sp.]|jgi:anti-anti-sigma factor|nr:STAS domain-containing protein [Actinophytocola sp.]